MGFRATPQFKGLTRQDNPSGKHRANAKKIVYEMLSDRYSKSVTLDRDFSFLNEYEGATTGQEGLDILLGEAEAYRSTVTLRNGETAEKRLRKDAVIGIACIIKVPDEIAREWTPEQNMKFYKDSMAVMADIQPDLFSKKNFRFSAIHRDEGTEHTDDLKKASEHMHAVYVPKDGNEHYCGNRLDAKFLSEFNKTYPAKMRAKGWDMEDLDVTDWERAKTEPSYRKERKQKRNGLSVNEYNNEERIRISKEQADAAEQYEQWLAELQHELEAWKNDRDEMAEWKKEQETRNNKARQDLKHQQEQSLKEQLEARKERQRYIRLQKDMQHQQEQYLQDCRNVMHTLQDTMREVLGMSAKRDTQLENVLKTVKSNDSRMKIQEQREYEDDYVKSLKSKNKASQTVMKQISKPPVLNVAKEPEEKERETVPTLYYD